MGCLITRKQWKYTKFDDNNKRKLTNNIPKKAFDY